MKFDNYFEKGGINHMRRLILSLSVVFMLLVTLTSCGGGGSASGEPSGGSSSSGGSLYYANWWCTTNQCSSVMGGNSGSAGPFPSLNECEQWRQTYILTSTCETSPRGGSSDLIPPTISSSSPSNGTTGVAVNTAISATFSEAMDASTVTGATFTVRTGQTDVPGIINYSGTTATFTPNSSLGYSTTYNATVTTAAKDLAGNALASDHVWSFTTATAPSPTKHYIFLTSLSYDGDLRSAGGGSTGLEGADKICANHAAGGALGGTWKAWLSDSSTDAIDRINDVGPWYLVGTDTVVFNNKANLTTLPLTWIHITELGIEPALYTNAWTGTLTGGNKSIDLCADWTSNNIGVRGLTGYVYLGTTNWTQSSNPACSSKWHLYCIQQ